LPNFFFDHSEKIIFIQILVFLRTNALAKVNPDTTWPRELSRSRPGLIGPIDGDRNDNRLGANGKHSEALSKGMNLAIRRTCSLRENQDRVSTPEPSQPFFQTPERVLKIERNRPIRPDQLREKAVREKSSTREVAYCAGNASPN